MALSDLAVFNEWTYSTATEIIAQQVDKFNAASANTIILRAAAHTGDFSEEAFWKSLGDGLVRRRNVYGSGAVAAIDLEHLVANMVKIAAGTPPINMPPSQFTWIQRSPEEAGIVIGRQLAPAIMADMLNTALMAAGAALSQDADVTNDQSATAGGLDLGMLIGGARLFGDRADAIVAWAMHSQKLFDIYDEAYTNGTGLFEFGTINVRQDGFGRRFIISDSPSLVEAGAPDVYTTLGLTTGAAMVDQNNDYFANIETSNGDENIQRTFQSEWTFSLGLKGFAWDKTNGGKSPTNAALGTSTNWDRYATSHKDLAGVVVLSQ